MPAPLLEQEREATRHEGCNGHGTPAVEPAAAASPARRRSPGLVAVAAGTAGIAAVALVDIVLSPGLAVTIAGCLLLVAGFAVMLPCQMQMSLTTSGVFERLRETEGGGSASVLARTVWFSVGYLAFYAPVAVALGAVAWLLGDHAWIAILGGAAAALVLGLAALGRGRPRWLSQCRGPLWLLASGRTSFRRPLRAGWAYARYCVTCCGPYAYALVVLAGGTSSVWLGAGLVLAYAVTMVVPALGVALIAPSTSERIARRADRLTPVVHRATGLALVGLAIVLVPVAIAAAVA